MTVRWNAQPSLRRPTLVAAFSGWNDAADAASDGVRWLARTVGARVFATLDSGASYALAIQACVEPDSTTTTSRSATTSTTE